ncbi:MAG: hypothetical protein D6744_02365 [Planctomycetota bacterium]|nr:MAG: hypothetical protein D6744_02365 [Planctomycetota bacterium]
MHLMILRRFRSLLAIVSASMAVALVGTLASRASAQTQPIRVSFLWHMHQPIYYPYETPVQVDAAGRFSYSVVDVHNQRLGPYTGWPRDAVQAGLSLPYLGAQVSFSGSLIQNLDALETAGVNGGQWTNWDSAYGQAIGWATSLGNPRLDMVAFGFHHPLMPLLDEQDIRMQIRLHKRIYQNTWSAGPVYSRGMFPAETAFAARMIPALVAEGVEWVIVDNIHFDRACVGYPHTNASNLFAPNPSDQINPDPAASGGAWVQLQNLWAPSRVSAPFGYQPHYAQHIDPDTGAATRIIVVPAARYEGNEDGRGGYGAFLYDQVMDQYLPYNTDAAHPMLVLLHHDGDNFGGGSESYYHSNFQNMVNWISGDPDYEATTVQDYLDRFPPDPCDVIHVEPGAWAGADNGDPEFKKWLGDPDANGWSPDRNSWAVLTAAKHRVFMADAIQPVANLNNVLNGTGSNTAQAWHWLLVSEASDYWYWDGTELWDSNVTRGCNQAVAHADAVIAGQADNFAPTVFVPQREPYNPGGFEWGPTTEPSDFEVWTYAYDVSGLASVTLRWRVDADGANPIASVQNETYAGGVEVGPWNDVPMSASDTPPPAGNLTPTYRALRYSAMITGQQDVLIDYYVEAIDNQGNVARSDIQHVYVGVGDAGGGGGGVTITPDPAVAGQPVTISYDPAGGPLSGAAQVYLHYGFDGWSTVVSPDPAMTWNAGAAAWEATVTVSSSASQLDVVFTDGAGVWDNNNGADWHFTVTGGGPGGGFVMDGQLDAGAAEVASNGARHLWAALDGDVLYVATEDAGEGDDIFLYLAQTPGALQPANWAKAGQVAKWDAYLADENDNGFADWFDASGARQSATGANGGVLEGTLNLADEFGATPSAIYLAVGLFDTPDGGALRVNRQVPASINGDGNVDAGEYVWVDLGALGGCDEDVNGDGVVDLTDLAVVLSNFDASGATHADGDIDGDGDVDLTDLALLLAAFDAICS